MISIASVLDEYDIAQEIRIERQVHKGSFLLLEGKTDVSRFSEFMDEIECSIVNCYGRDKSAGAIRILYDEGFPGVLALVDADFDRVLGTLEAHEGIIYSEGHDFDIDWARSDAMRRYLIEVGDAVKCAAIGTHKEIVDAIIESIKPISIARFLNERGNMRYKLSDIYIDRCYFDMNTNLDQYVELIFEGKSPPQAEKDAVKKLIESHLGNDFDLEQITNGHDFFTALGVCLKSRLGERKAQQAYGKEVELHVRLTFNDLNFRALGVYKNVLAWEAENLPYLILDNRLR